MTDPKHEISVEYLFSFDFTVLEQILPSLNVEFTTPFYPENSDG